MRHAGSGLTGSGLELENLLLMLMGTKVNGPKAHIYQRISVAAQPQSDQWSRTEQAAKWDV